MDQLLHDRVNVVRLVSRLQRDVSERVWEKRSDLPAWVQVSRAQTNVKYARKLLAKIRKHEDDVPYSPSTSSFPTVVKCLDDIEPVLQKAYNELAPKPQIRKSLVSSLPKPELCPSVPATAAPTTRSTSEGMNRLTQPESTHPVPQPLELDLLLASDNAVSLPSVPNSPFAPRTLGSEMPIPTDNEAQVEPASSSFLATSLQTQEELSAQLAQMAARLKLNTMHFTEALEKDKAVLEGAEMKLQGNFTRMKAERSRLGAYSSKSGGTTWIVFFSIIVVAIAWAVMFVIIRLT
ncbi:uncharacterized protein EI90DRAFT_3150204 [Cantharellus anzutake]|uniref:uncharacterized protein n=1 Tax=Cantharellus anzutake TaxID=1750568 RepID=UPI001908CE7B|nr:uncharacterized protein EI90DRAFT_3150204 [Cantharellus anzutake]KAF8342054.1 hypothetical protein EI90DRAFT_3150204 [Cantharellus anzutake]